AWFVTKQEIEAAKTDVTELDEAYEQVKSSVHGAVDAFYKTPCPHADADSDSTPHPIQGRTLTLAS
ncbi:hypothetical protein, partial [Halosegnis marinus]